MKSVDVIVVGAGNAALCAAISGHAMIILDAASRKVLKQFRPPGAYPGDLMGIGDITMAADSSHAYISVQDMDDKGARDQARQVDKGAHYVAAIDLKTLEISQKIPTEVAIPVSSHASHTGSATSSSGSA